MASYAAILAARVVSLVSAAVQLPLLTRVLSPADYALVAAALATGTWVSLAGSEATVRAFQRFPGETDDRANYRYARRQLAAALVAIVLIGVAVGLAFQAFSAAVAAIGWGLGLASMRFISTAWLMWFSPWRYSTTLMASTTSRTAVLVGLVVAGAPAAYSVALAGLTSATIGLALAPRSGPARRVPRPWPRYLGVSLAIGSAGIAVIINFDQIVLPHMGDQTAAGRYAAMANLATITLGALLGLINPVYYPRVLRLWNAEDYPAANRWVERLTDLAVGLGALSVLIALLAGSTLLDRVVGSAYTDVPILSCLLAATGLYVVGQQLSWIHTFRLEHHAVRNRMLLAGAVNIAFFFALVPHFSAAGAAAATALGFGCHSLLMYAGSGLSRHILLLVALSLAMSLTALTAGPPAGAALAGTVVALTAASIYRRERQVQNSPARVDPPTQLSPSSDQIRRA
jgi:O-antigen/teichoic acid export membrane protein